MWKAGKGREGCILGIRGGEIRVEKGPVPVAPQTTYLVFYLPDREENGKGPQEKGKQGKPTRMSKMVIFLQTVVWKVPQQTGGNQLCPCRLRCPSPLLQALEAQWGTLGLWLSSRFRIVSRFQGASPLHSVQVTCLPRKDWAWRPEPNSYASASTVSQLPTLQHSRKSAVSMTTIIPRVLPLPSTHKLHVEFSR